MRDFTAAKILADSVGPHGIRVTTMEVVFPRPYLAEFNTHRALSRNSASSRAIPTEKQIERAEKEPYVPNFSGRVKGMGVGETLNGKMQFEAQREWLAARDAAVKAARGLLHVDKSRANRLLEPFLWHTCIVSATEWENFYALRAHKDAQPEFQTLAYMMRDTMEASEPVEREFGDWHLPMVSDADKQTVWPLIAQYPDGAPIMAKVSAGRCARVSYDTHWRSEDPGLSKQRWEGLSTRGHWSPAEHPAMCTEDPGPCGNFTGWKQLRKFYANEAIFRG